MPDFLFGSFPNPNSNRNSWFERVRENLAQLIAPTGLSPSSANGAPLHLLKPEKSPRARRAQSASLLIHAAVITALLLLAMYPRIAAQHNIPSDTEIFHPLRFPAALLATRTSVQPSPGSGSGAGQTLIPATSGNLPPMSSIQLVRPTLPDKQEHVLPIPPTILDLAAPPILTEVEHMGLPWRKDDTRSPGMGPGHTLGDRGGPTVGQGGDGPAGYGQAGNPPYAPGMTAPTCIYCPDPRYTDEAREAKLQGSVLLQVMVGADGRAEQIRVVRGLGMGLDERATQIVQGWRFAPARDGSRHAIASWVTVEAVYRLF
jgi:protein TonB